MKKLLLLLTFSFCGIVLNAQTNLQEVSVDIRFINDSTQISNCPVYIDSNRNLNPTDLLQKKWLQLATIKKSLRVPSYWVTRDIYLKLNLINTGTHTDTVCFFPGASLKKIDVYEIGPKQHLIKLKDNSSVDGFEMLALKPGEHKNLLIALCFNKSRFNYLAPQIILAKYLDKYKSIHYNKNELLKVIGYLVSGVMLMMILFSIANYLLGGKKEFLLNGLYTSCMFLLIFFSNYFDHKTGKAAGIFFTYFSFSLLAIGTIFYIAFTRAFLNTKETMPLLNKIFIYEEKIFFLIFLCFSFLYFFTNDFKILNILENLMKVTALLIGLFYIVIAFAQKNRLINYLGAGNAMLILFAITSYYFLLSTIERHSVFTSPFFYFEVGIMCELFFFLIGLTYKNRVELIGKIKEQEALKLDAEKNSFENKLAILNVRQNERARISADMHDDLGAGITAIRLYSELAKSKLGKEVHPEIEKISTSANELLNNMNAIIWAMNSSNDSVSSMIAYIRSYAKEYFENSGINCRFNFDTDLPDLKVSGQLRKNIFLVVKEALNNVVKYAHATEVTISAFKVDNGISFTIKDNGVGIDFDNLRHFGNGLKNMKARMDEFDIKFTIENNNGTLVTLLATFIE